MHLGEERGERRRLLLTRKVEQVVGAALYAALNIPVCLVVAVYEVETHLCEGGEGGEGGEDGDHGGDER